MLEKRILSNVVDVIHDERTVTSGNQRTIVGIFIGEIYIETPGMTLIIIKHICISLLLVVKVCTIGGILILIEIIR